MRPENEKRYAGLFRDYEVMDITRPYFSESSRPWKTISRIHAGIRARDPEAGSPASPLWIVLENTKTR